MIERGLYSHERAKEIRAAGEAAATRTESRQAPFHEDWSDMVPHPAWPIPKVAAWWDRG
jgi:hypothetical protein